VVGHVLERVSLTRLLLILDIAIQFIIGTNTNIAGIALQAFIGLPHSRTQELEADLIGLRLMSKACFDPDAVVG
jgi:metalloendopeptidase OMA1, mitochondrial